jgi:hypothetical protein
MEFRSEPMHYEEHFSSGHMGPGEDVLDRDDAPASSSWQDGGISEKCNLIINYLPHDIDDATLKVSRVCMMI